MKRILVAVDFSEASADALKQAVTIAEKFEAKLLVLHVIHDPGKKEGLLQTDPRIVRTVQEELGVEH